MRNKELIKWNKLWKLKNQSLPNFLYRKFKFSQTIYIESMELSWENLPTHHLLCLGLKTPDPLLRKPVSQRVLLQAILH